MSRKATMEYVGAKRRAYSELKSKKAKSAAIDEFCQITGAERKYAIRLLNGSRRYREHAGRGKTYTAGAEARYVMVMDTVAETAVLRNQAHPSNAGHRGRNYTASVFVGLLRHPL